MPIKIPLLLEYIDEAGKDGSKELTAYMSDPVNTERGSARDHNYKYETNFSLKVPDHIWNYLAGKTVPTREYGTNRNPQPKKYGKTVQEFPKTLSRPTLSDLCRYWNDLLFDYRWLRDVTDAGLDKVIFYDFQTASGDYQDEYSAKIRLGKIASIRFTYCIGYRTTARSYEKEDSRYDSNMVLISSHGERKLYAMKFVKWTEKREQFFDQLAVDFDNVIGKITEFESAITEKGLNKLIDIRMAGNRLLDEGSGSGWLLPDNVTIRPGDRVLVTNQTDPAMNGIREAGEITE